MAQTFHLRIVTPTQQIVREETEEMQVPGKEGYLGILAGHAPLLSELQVGEITYRQGRELRYLAVSWGFVEVLPEQVTVLAETAEKSSDIDVSRAQASKERAERRLNNPDPDTDINRATVALQKSLSRLQVASHGK
ncbi:MAG: F0F1 ATP synthase subunit epsilon [Acidobacteria bacterium]|nr:F0F1 ATP synthase subunit epsilon [Acidobacteriota bacterium]MCH8266415.1 F0F1 ATP synthase subunit epsilon [Acidobacteriota bacterium]MCZ6491051.1 F0F1 ATP synthase subunit epsilon [Acidobacteriota bacterium]MCZ6752446.1 F0F1 ATP synthase subunit epsilon [Acidobacteriota bacterium]